MQPKSLQSCWEASHQPCFRANLQTTKHGSISNIAGESVTAPRPASLRIPSLLSLRSTINCNHPALQLKLTNTIQTHISAFELLASHTWRSRKQLKLWDTLGTVDRWKFLYCSNCQTDPPGAGRTGISTVYFQPSRNLKLGAANASQH